jgi:hypothetical protein
MPTFKSLFLFLAIFMSVLIGCNPDDTVNTPATITSIKDNMTPDSTDGWLYYSFDNDVTVPATQAGTDAWDIKFRFIPFDQTGAIFQKIFLADGAIFLNSPTAGNAAGKTKGYVADTSFMLVTAVGDDSKLRSDDTTKGSQIITFNGFYTYNPTARTASPNPNKTLVVRTAKGKYVKMQLQSIYKGKPLVPAMTDPVGYYSFQYVKSDTKSFK